MTVGEAEATNASSANAEAEAALAYHETLSWLYRTQLFGIKLGLDNVQRLLNALALPDKQQRILHVAGTNGKGSVCAMMAAICRAEGYRTGLFTSPHLVTYRERIQVNGEMISLNDVASNLAFIRDLTRDWDPHPTFFELTTALALLHFKKQECEIVVLETGLGGRLDATNAVTPVVSVITPISLDHQKWLGQTLQEIAGEKAGIIKHNVPVVSAEQDPVAERVIRARAMECNAPLEIVTQSFKTDSLELAGRHQTQNAAVAIAALHAAGIRLNQNAITPGLQSVHWPARFQKWDDRTIIDGAHNPAAARVLAETWREIFGEQRATIVLAILADKDVDGICRALAPIAQRFVLPQIRSQRALPPDDLAQCLASITPTLHYSVSPTIVDALELARAEADPILITGSLHFAGEILALFHNNPASFEECAQ